MATTPAAFYEQVAELAGLDFVTLDSPPPAAAVALIEPWAARRYRMLPVELTPEVLRLAVADPSNTAALDTAAALSRRRVEPVIAAPDALNAAIERAYAAVPQPVPKARAVKEERRRWHRTAHEHGIGFVALDSDPRRGDPVSLAAARMVPEGVCREHRVLPISWRDGVMTIATSDPRDELALSAVHSTSGQYPRLVIAPPQEIDRAIDRVWPPAAGTVTSLRPESAPARARLPVPAPGEEPAKLVVPARQLLGELLVDNQLISADELQEALALQERFGDRLGEVLVHHGVVSETSLSTMLAEQLHLTFTDLRTFEPDPDAVEMLPEQITLDHRIVPLAVTDGKLYLAMADALDPEALAAIREHTELPIRTVVASPSVVEELIGRIHSGHNVQVATRKLLESAPEDSAHFVLSRGQRIVFSLILIVSLICLVINPITTIIVFNISSILFYTSFSLYRFKLIYNALAHDLELPVSDEEVAALDERNLPVYTLLVPLYREAAVAPKLAKHIADLDYPPTKLDVKLLLEAEDDETIDALRAMDLPPHFKMTIVPDAQPKTKPKACNYGITQARGEYVVIYDAEDIPEPDQLKKVVVAFRKSAERIACIQCKLNYYNRDQNTLTRFFTTEYSMWFDLFMPGLDAADCPIPLGGTSNHFVKDKLLELGGWDPFNVTEDADLGIRLHKSGYKTAIVDSTTYEEANSDLFNWIRQRSRWVKGYIQTWLVQMRHPLRLLGELGLRRWLSFQMVVGGTFWVFLLNPIYWILTTLWLLTEADVIRSLFPGFVYYAAAIGLHIGNFTFAYVTAAGASRRGYDELVKYAILSPVYWGLMSIGAWKGLIQLFFKPFYWEKTEHGLDVAYEAPQSIPEKEG